MQWWKSILVCAYLNFPGELLPTQTTPWYLSERDSCRVTQNSPAVEPLACLKRLPLQPPTKTSGRRPLSFSSGGETLSIFHAVIFGWFLTWKFIVFLSPVFTNQHLEKTIGMPKWFQKSIFSSFGRHWFQTLILRLFFLILLHCDLGLLLRILNKYSSKQYKNHSFRTFL